MDPHSMLSVVLTVHNAEKTLADNVARMLDVLPDLASRFELLIVDDGSTDQTDEVAHELARNYPQLSVARHPRQMGTDAAAKTALARASGDIVILHEATEETAGQPRRIVEMRRGTQLPLVAATDPLRLLQDPSIQSAPTRATESASERAPVPQVMVVPRRTDRPVAPSRVAPAKPVSADHPNRSLPRILARIMAQRPVA